MIFQTKKEEGITMYNTDLIIVARDKMLEGLNEMLELGVPAEEIVALVNAYAGKVEGDKGE